MGPEVVGLIGVAVGAGVSLLVLWLSQRHQDKRWLKEQRIIELRAERDRYHEDFLRVYAAFDRMELDEQRRATWHMTQIAELSAKRDEKQAEIDECLKR